MVDYSHEDYERTGVIVWTMKMPKTCIECPMQFGGLCFVAPAEVDDTQVAPSPFECTSRPDWCPLEPAEEVYMKHYEQGRRDEHAIQNGTLMQIFNPD